MYITSYFEQFSFVYNISIKKFLKRENERKEKCDVSVDDHEWKKIAFESNFINRIREARKLKSAFNEECDQ